MNNMVKISVVLVALFSISAVAQVKDKSVRINAKCYVELYGGATTITGITVKPKSIRKLPNRLTGKSIFVAGMKGKQKIYKVLECVASKNKFKSKFANSLFEQLPR